MRPLSIDLTSTARKPIFTNGGRETKLTKLNSQADNYADKEGPLSSVERFIAYVLDLLVG